MNLKNFEDDAEKIAQEQLDKRAGDNQQSGQPGQPNNQGQSNQQDHTPAGS